MTRARRLQIIARKAGIRVRHMVDCTAHALSALYKIPVQAARQNFFLYDQRLSPKERRYTEQHCICPKKKE